ncbi:PREDICTED: mitotic spindle assembly checkpoint protein MAD2A [Chaetura pelagica]|uniref:mitotic spindle assembly checkpoint protein MAD2A n=1 Tax=Chaetura pelagica TaxID=8897 RepID=UPI000523582B|nr:PREDICTED: mitotic spindle assembly checkpoint protein MAD2A [Chaetura pelagica]
MAAVPVEQRAGTFPEAPGGVNVTSRLGFCGQRTLICCLRTLMTQLCKTPGLGRRLFPKQRVTPWEARAGKGCRGSFLLPEEIYTKAIMSRQVSRSQEVLQSYGAAYERELYTTNVVVEIGAGLLAPHPAFWASVPGVWYCLQISRKIKQPFSQLLNIGHCLWRTMNPSAELSAAVHHPAHARAYGINSILYQRGIYPPETFTRVQKYGLTLLVTTDPELKNYLNNVVEQMKEWLYKCIVQRLVVVISSTENNEVLERWQFDIECDKTAKDETAPREKSQKAIQDEIRSVIRQITATVTFLPLLETACAFDLLIYTDKDLAVPEKWEESGPQFIANSEEVRLRSFTTTVHKVSSMVAYKKDSFP